MFGIPDERLGEVPAAAVYCESDRDLTGEQLREFLQDKIAAYKIPVTIWVHHEPLVKLGTGKIDKKVLRDKYGGGGA